MRGAKGWVGLVLRVSGSGHLGVWTEVLIGIWGVKHGEHSQRCCKAVVGVGGEGWEEHEKLPINVEMTNKLSSGIMLFQEEGKVGEDEL